MKHFLLSITVLKNFLYSKMLRKILLYVAGSILLLLVLFFIFRNVVLHAVVDKKCKQFEEKYQAELIIGKAKFTGFTGVTIRDIKIVPYNRSVLFASKKVYAHFRLFPLIIGNIHINKFTLENTLINIIRKGKVNNYDFLFTGTKDTIQQQSDSSFNYAARFNKIFSAVFSNIPDKIEIRNFLVRITADTIRVSSFLPAFRIENRRFLSSVFTSEEGKNRICFVRGEINKTYKRMNFMVYSFPGDKVRVPYIQSKYNFRCDFDTLYAGVLVDGNNSKISITTETLISGLVLNHKKIAQHDVKFKKISFKLCINSFKDFLELDSSSVIAYHRFYFNPYIRISHKPVVKALLKINKEFVAQDLFESLPSGIFENFEGIKTTGKLRLYVYFDLDMRQPDSLKFEASLTGKYFRVIKYGATDFRKINSTFSHTAYVNGMPVRTFDVGPENPSYTPLEAISTYLKEAVLISENGGFFYGDGFNAAAFRESIIANIHARRFVRGGSTIDMQLVKNVFLSKNKTISRKAEEILIAWLINNNHLCTKEKMYEVYLNLIEWGPGIYGISEASDYYFQKKPSQLSVSESIFLASIIPKPRWFKSSFDENGKLLQRNQAYFDLIATKLIAKGGATPNDTMNMLKKVELKGAAKAFMAKDTARFHIK